MLKKGEIEVDDEDYTYEQYIVPESNAKVVFEQKESNEDPAVMIDMGGTSSNYPLYTAKVVFNKPINLTSDDAAGKRLTLFGTEVTISGDSDSDTLILYKASQEITLSKPEEPETTVTIGDKTYTIELRGFSKESGHDYVTLTVNGETEDIKEGDSKEVGGLEIYVKSASSWNNEAEGVAVLLIGSDEVKLVAGEPVKINDEEVDGTLVRFNEGTSSGQVRALSTIEIVVFAEEDEQKYIKEGEEFVDPVFGTFKVVFNNMANGPSSEDVREEIKITGDSNSGNIYFTDTEGETKTTQFVYYHKDTSTWYVAGGDGNKDDPDKYAYILVEGTKYSPSEFKNKYLILGTGDSAHIVEVTSVSIDVDSTSDSDDYVVFTDRRTGATYKVEFEAENNKDVTKDFYIEGKKYTLHVQETGGDNTVDYVWVKDSVTGTTAFPTIETGKGAKFAVIPANTTDVLSVSSDEDGNADPDLSGGTIVLPTGNVEVTYADNTTNKVVSITVTDASDDTNKITLDSTTTKDSLKIGGIVYYLEASGIGTGTATLKVGLEADQDKDDDVYNVPTFVLIEEENEKPTTATQYKIIVPFKYNDDDGVGTVTQTSNIKFTESSVSFKDSSDDDIKYALTSYGTYLKLDVSENVGTLTITYPDEQMYANIAVLATEASVSTTEATEGQTITYEEVVPIETDIAYLDTDSAVSAAKTTKNLILVGGPAVNALVRDLFRDKFNVSTADDGWIYGAQLAEKGYCGENGVYNGEQGLIKLVNDAFAEGKVALIVMGCDVKGRWTKAAARVLQQYDDYKDKLSGKEEVRLTGSVENPTIS